MNPLIQFRKTTILPFVLLLGPLCFEALAAMEVLGEGLEAVCLWPSVAMGAMNVWFHFQDGINQLSRERATSSLAAEGILFTRHGTSSGPTFGLIAFDKEDPDLLEFVQRSSHGGADRIMAVDLNKIAVTGATPWKLLQAGATDVLTWNSMTNPAAAIAARFQRWQAVEEIVNSESVQSSLVGRSSAWVAVLREVIEVAYFTESAILITGETGTGKELVARLIHMLDKRPGKRDLVVLDCTTVVPQLSGSEFFGHERGAFTHAVATREGAFALADGGTLFLDEVGELPPALQAELLRVVQEGAYKRVGSNTWKKTSFRLICATNQDLRCEEQRGNFRTDFYHRIASCTCCLPSLEERREDIIPLTQHFLSKLASDEKAPGLTSAVRDYLLSRKYPGNVRELRQLVTRIAYRHVGRGPISVGDIPEEERVHAAHLMNEDWCDEGFARAIRYALLRGRTLREISSKAAETAIRFALEDENHNVPRAARKLGVTDRALQMRRASDRRRHKLPSRGD